MGKVHPKMHMELDPDNETYPTVRLVHIQFVADTLKVLTISDREIGVETIDNRKDEGVAIIIGRKRLMSDLHKIAFLRSLEADDPWILDLKNFAWLKYKCSICTHVHTLDLVFCDARNIRSPMFT